MPFVLPANEESQFNSLVQNRQKVEKQRDKAVVEDVKDIKLCVNFFSNNMKKNEKIKNMQKNFSKFTKNLNYHFLGSKKA